MIVTAADVTWTKNFNSQTPGSHVVLIAQEAVDAIRGRVAGYELRDTLAILSSGPRVRFGFLFRKPLEGTAVATILKYGTGALNINACRVNNGSAKQVTAGRRTIRWGVGEGGSSYEKGTGAIWTNEGRWPSNLVLVHGPGCRTVGTRRVKSTPPIERTKAAGFHPENRVFGTGEGEFRSTGYADADGFESVPAWECEPGCSAGFLDEQTGTLTSGRLDRGKITAENKTYGIAPKNRFGVYEMDSGGASRFFPQFADDGELFEWIRRLVGEARQLG